MKPRHHAGTFQTSSATVRQLANAHPDAICWRDGLTLAQHPRHHDGRRPTWHGGHTIDGWIDAPPWYNVTRRPPPGPWIAPEASTCNAIAGAALANKTWTNPQSRDWFG